jgi:hypothetical protein
MSSLYICDPIYTLQLQNFSPLNGTKPNKTQKHIRLNSSCGRGEPGYCRNILSVQGSSYRLTLLYALLETVEL